MPEGNIPMPKEEYGLDDEKIMVPMELVEFISSEKTSSQIADLCAKNGVEDEKRIEEISYRIALVILGELPKENFATVLKEESGLDETIAKKISSQANNLIFSQMPQAKFQAQAPVKTKETISLEKEIEKIPEESLRPRGKDTYRETLE